MNHEHTGIYEGEPHVSAQVADGAESLGNGNFSSGKLLAGGESATSYAVIADGKDNWVTRHNRGIKVVTRLRHSTRLNGG